MRTDMKTRAARKSPRLPGSRLVRLGSLGALLSIAACCGSDCTDPAPCYAPVARPAGATKPTEQRPVARVATSPGPHQPSVAETPAATPASTKVASEPAKGHDTGIHNLKQLSSNLIRGAQPEGDEDYAQLSKMGVKTIISDDGARPNVEAAEKYGMRYIHIPIGYDGIPPEKMVLFAKAYTTAQPPFFVHCHHGQHRGPAACSIGRILLDGIAPEQCVAEMKEAGTDPKYKGLYAVPGAFVRPTAEQLAAVSDADLPPVMKVPGFQQAMVEIDQTWSRLIEVKKAGWKSPPDHPDVTPGHESLMLKEMLRELGRTSDLTARPEDFRKRLADSEALATALQATLEAKSVDSKAAATAFDAVKQSCTSCHAIYRDNK